MLINVLRIMVGLALLAGCVLHAQAYRPKRPPPATGFVLHRPDADALHLPSNAKGILFQMQRPEKITVAAYLPGKNVLLASLPSPLRANRFSITGPGGKRLAAVITRLEVDDVLDEPMRYFVASPGSPCATMSPECRARYDSEEGMRWVERGLQDGTLRDATEEVRRGVGLFRLAPQGGLSEGTSYTFTYQPDKDARESSLPATARVHVDALAVIRDEAPFLLQPLGNPRPLFYSQSMVEQVALTQAFRYLSPARYGPYAPSLMYFTRTMEVKGQASCDSGSTCLQDNPSYLELRRHKADSPDKVVVGMDCGIDQTPMRHFQLIGFAGLLEVEDRPQAVPVLAFSLGGADVRCEGTGLLRKALAGGRTAEIRDIACQVRAMSPQYVADIGAMTATLGALVGDGDAQTRRCALSGLAKFASLGFGPNAGWPKQEAVLRQTVTLLVHDLRGNDAEDRENAIGGLGWIQELARPRVHGGRDVAVLLPALPALIERAGDTGTAEEVRRRVIILLGELGPQAAPAQEVLMRIAQGENNGLRWHARMALRQITGREEWTDPWRTFNCLWANVTDLV